MLELENKNSIGKVKTITEFEFWQIDFITIRIGVKIIYSYDKNGNLLERVIESYDYSISDIPDIHKMVVKYDEYGNQSTAKNFRSDGGYLNFITFKYDDKGNQIEIKETDASGSLQNYSTFIYDSNRNKVEENYFNYEGKLEEKRTSIFNEKRNVLEKYIFNNYGGLISRYIYSYNEKDNNYETKLYSYKGELVSQLNYEFDNFGNWIKETEIRIFSRRLPDNKGGFIVKKYEVPQIPKKRVIEYY